ncbi:hypothetical protein VL05_02325 [Bacillus stratosphericus]|nr:hypothetical protein VL05_02325 [Bacillus stratosphericus]KML51768.1 hypothetical protein VL17_13955 [Bacillus stratosphericus]
MSDKITKSPRIRFARFTDAWEQRELGEITVKIGSGKTPKGGESSYVLEGIPLLRSQNVHDDLIDLNDVAYITPQTDEEMKNSRVVKNDVLLNITGASIGRSAVYRHSSPANVNQHVCIVRPVGGYSSDFIQLNLTSPKGQHQIDNNQAGGGREGLNFQQIRKMSFAFPSIEEQDQISVLLKKLDYLITLYQRELELLKNTKKRLLQKMFPKDGANVPEIRFAGFTDVWEQRKLGDIVQITMGQSPDSNNYTDNPDDHILVQGNADMKNGRVVPRVWTTQVTKQAEKNDLILSVRAPVGDVGKTDYDVVLGRGVASIKGNEFIFQSLGRMKQNGYWTKLSTGSTFESINSNDIRGAHIKIPNEEEQKKIGDFFSNLDNLFTLHQLELNSLKNLKKSLLQQMFI